MKYILLLFTLFLTSCSQKVELPINEVNYSMSFIEQGNSQLDRRWWNSFENDELSRFVQLGLQDNLSLKAADLRLKSSAINAKIAAADLYPTLNLNANTSSDFNHFGDIDSASFGISSSWELDLWGGIAANENKAYWNHQEQLAIYRGRANLVAGSIANAWLNLISEQEKKVVLADQFQRTQDALDVISRRFAMGKNSVTNIWQQQKLLKSIEVLQSKNQADLYLYQQTLALWLGVPTNTVNINNINTWPLLPELPNMGVPAESLQHRPDIEQSFAKIKAENEQLAIAIANRYPRITLRANYSTSKSTISDLFDDWSGNLIASLALPLFDSGERKSIVEQRKLLLEALIVDYQQVWLEAIASVNQVLINEAQLLKVSSNLASQLSLAQRTERLTQLQYFNGKTNYLNLLKAQESILQLERQLIEANKRVSINRVLLYRELSHGDFTSNSQASDGESNTGKQS
jgi:NodT family efflux transporter outer membrane factor (OMF) lipoprotein